MAGSFGPGVCPTGFQYYYGEKTGCVPIGLNTEQANSYLASAANAPMTPSTPVLTTALVPTTGVTGSASTFGGSPTLSFSNTVRSMLPNITGDALTAAANAINPPEPKPPAPSFFQKLPILPIVLGSVGIVAALVIIKTLRDKRSSSPSQASASHSIH